MKKNYKLLLTVFVFALFFCSKSNAQCIPTVGNAGATGDFINNFSLGALSNLSSGDNGFDYALYTPSATYTRGLTYSYTIQTGSLVWPQGVGIWIDYNGNNDFSDPGEFVYASPTAVLSSTTLTGTIIISATASPGVRRMRVCAKGNATVVATESCSLANFGEYEDYNIVIKSTTVCSATPIGGTVTASSLNPCPGANVNFVLSGASFTSNITYQWARATSCTGPWTNISGIANPSALTPVLNIPTIAGTIFSYRCNVTCTASGLSNVSNEVCVTAQSWFCTTDCYSISTAMNPASEDILNVKMGSLNNTTTCANSLTGSQGIATGSPNRYANFTGSGGVPSAAIYKGVAQSFSLTIGTCGSSFPVSTKIYIDYNHNASFSDAGEEVYSNTSITNISPAVIVAGSFVPSATALTGCTRMRVIVMSTSLGTITSTGAYRWGETEDYSVNIVQPSTYDPTITAINIPNGNCFSSNETVTATLCNYGSNVINIGTNNVTVTLHVTGPSGIISYPVILNTGTLPALGTTCLPITFNGVDLYQGGNYSFNTSLSLAGLTNGNAFNDSLNYPATRSNSRPVNAVDYTLCQGSIVPLGQGLNVSGCETTITDSVTINFTITGPCTDNTGATGIGNNVGLPSNCADEYACAFANGYLPILPPGAVLNMDAVLTISHLSTQSSSWASEAMMNLYGSSPTGADLFSPGLAGSSINIGDPDFTYSRTIPSAQLISIFSSLDTNDALHIGYWESWNDTFDAPDILINAGGGTTTASLKIYFQYANPVYAWYDTSSGGTSLYAYSHFDPLSHPNALVNNTNTPGVSTFYAACSANPSCRLPVNFTVNDSPDLVCSSGSTCQNATNGMASVSVNNTPFTLHITSPQPYQLNMAGAVFGPNITSNPIAGDIVYYSNPDTGCVAYPAGTFAGKIALIDRGSCLFELKVFNAQNAGALGVIIVNHIPGPIFTPGAANLYTITIPAIMISKADGEIIKNLLSQTANVSCNTPLYPYSILWNTNSNSPTIGALQAGVYAVDVTNSIGCSSTCTTEVLSYSGPDITCTPAHDCNGTNNSAMSVAINDFPFTLNIITPVPYQFNMAGAYFGPNIVGNPILGDIVYYSNPDTGCVAYPPGTFAGKIALIDRGSCPFELKTFNAQNAGALGVIIVNNVPDPIFTLGGANLNNTTIPSVMISQADGQLIKNMLSQPAIVSCNTASYSYLWSTNATTSVITGIPYGTYSVNVTDANGCSSTCSQWVANGSFPKITTYGTSDCNLTNSGSAAITIHDYPFILNIDSPVPSQIAMTGANFGPDIETNSFSGEIVYYSNPDTGCVAYPPGTFAGKIALIDRGSCFFELKTFNAQNAGAIGVIIVNNVPDPIFTMGAANLYTINIPAIMISQSDGLTIKNMLSQPSTVTCNTKSYSFYWYSSGDTTASISGLAPGSYYVYAADDGCAGGDVYEVTGPIQMPVISSIGKATLCNDSVVLEASGSGKAIHLNGVDQWIDLGTDITNLNDADFTIEAWIRTTGFNEGIVALSNNDNSWDQGERALIIDTFGRAAFVVYGNNYIIAPPPVNDGNWHHIAVSWNDYMQVGKMFIDGTDQTFFNSYAANTDPNFGTFSIGRPNFGEANNFFNGEMDEVRIWNIARTQSQIQYYMSNPVNPLENGLRTYYKMDEGAGFITKDQTNGYHGILINNPTWMNSSAYGYSYLWSTNDTIPSVQVTSAGSYYVTITTPGGCSAYSDPFIVNSNAFAQTVANGPINFCNGGSVTLSVDPVVMNKRYASSVLGFSSQYTLNDWGAIQALGVPDVYPAYGDISQAWASSNPDDPREYLELGFLNPAPVNFIDIYETLLPGAVDTVYVKNPNTGLFEIVYASPAVIEPPVARIMHISFPTTAFPVSEIRIAMNSGAVPYWNEIDAVAIGEAPAFLWSNGDTTSNISVDSTGFYYYAYTQSNGCANTSYGIAVTELPCNVSLHLQLYIEGYYTGFGFMTSALFNQGQTTNNAIVDTIEIELHDQNFPYGLIESVKAILMTDGTTFATFNAMSDSYYLAIKHRNGIYTWSALPVTLGPVPVWYHFSIAASQAYNNKMREVESGVWALYAGDINQDENIDLLDLADVEADITAFNYGYLATDINGDGNVDLLDLPLVEQNINDFIFASYP